MEEELVIQELNTSFRNAVSRRREGYRGSHVLIISWAEADDPKIPDEVQNVHNLFEQKLGYNVIRYQIPSERPAPNLQLVLANLVTECPNAKESLIIIYYAGHGDANPSERKAIRAAKRTGGPTLNWYAIQPCLSSFEGDIWIILDCCYALQAARERGSQTHELLAASGIYERTPPAGGYSFTGALLAIMERLLSEKAVVTVEAIHTGLIKGEGNEKVCATPVRLLLKGDGESIEMKPVKDRRSSKEDTLDSRPLTVLSLRISLSKRFEDATMRRFQRWLRTHIPGDISAITVDRVFLRTEQIQSFLHQNAAPELHAAVASDLQSRNRAETITLQPSAFDSQFQKGHGMESTQARTALETLESWNESVYSSIEGNLLLNPSFSSELAIRNLSRDIGRIRQTKRLCYSDTTLALPLNHVKYLPIEGQLTYGQIQDEIVYIELREYNYPHDPKETALRKVRSLSRLFKETPPSLLSILPFAGYIDEPVRNRFGLAFYTGLKNSQDGRPAITLQEAYTLRRNIPLDDRFAVAIALAKTLSSLHAVGWLHKSLRSENIVFLSKFGEANHDLSQPYILGFDLSRPKSENSDNTKEFRRPQQIYTHPKRWGTPQEIFSPVHDIYSLGVILLEVGCWRSAAKFDKAKQNLENINDERKVRDQLVEAAETYLPHLAGRQYSKAVLTCLSDTLKHDAWDQQDPSRLHKAFTTEVLEVLIRGRSGL
ncbi:MAG: hypothetical protein Q9160_008119 [Pyrenula sp. 1 TL-2023]